MSELQFNLHQYVTIHGGRQALVTSRKVFGWREPEYEVQWLSQDMFTAEGVLEVARSTFSESELVALQPPKMVTQLEADRLANGVRQEIAAEFGNKIWDLRKQVERLEAAAKRRQKLTRASRSRKRR